MQQIDESIFQQYRGNELGLGYMSTSPTRIDDAWGRRGSAAHHASGQYIARAAGVL